MHIRIQPDIETNVVSSELNEAPVKSQRDVAELALANDMSLYLCSIYPNHRWAVCVDSRHGIAKVIEADLMPPELAYVILLRDINYSYKKAQAVLRRAGGEILERCRMSRERQTAMQVQDSIDAADKTPRGHVVIDTNNAANWCGEKNKTGGVIQ